MRKFLSLLLAVTLISSVSFGQTFQSRTNGEKVRVVGQESPTTVSTRSMDASYLSEDFEGGSLPTGWTEAFGSATNGFQFGTDLSSQYFVIPAHTTYAAVNDDDCNCDMSDVWLISPSVDLSAVAFPVLKFEYFFNNGYGGIGTVKYSIDGGTTWVDLQVLAANTAWELLSLDFTAVANQADVKVAFHYNDIGEWDYGLGIDDVSIEDLPTVADLIATPTGFISEYYAQPMDQAVAFMPTGNVENAGFELSDATNFDLTDGTYTDAQAITTPLANAANEDFTFASYTPAEGTVTFTYNANFATDYDPSNNIATKDFTFGGEELVRDNGVAAGNIGIGTPGGAMGNVFTISAQDTLTSVKWVMAGTAGDEVSVVVREFTTLPTTELGTSLSVINDGSAEYEANFPVGIILAPGTYFIGVVEGANNVGVEFTATPYIAATAWAYFSDAWNDLGPLGFEHTYHIRPQFADVIPVTDDLAMVSINNNPTIEAGAVDITGSIRNMGNQVALTSFDVVYTIDGGAASAAFNVTGVTVAPGATYDFTHDLQWTATPGQHTIEVTLSNPNGNLDENLADNVMSKMVLVVNEIFPKAVVYEEGTGTWCGWCVRGLVGLNTMAHNVTDGSWIGIGVHNGDPMVVADYDAAIGTFISGYPSGIMNRHTGEVDPGLPTLQAGYQMHVQETPIAKIELTDQTFEYGTHNWTVEVATTFALDITGANYNTALILLENGVTGTTADYNQTNYYAADQQGAGDVMVDWDGFDYNAQPSSVPASLMTYNHVARQLVDGWDGSTGSVPADVTYNVANTFSYSGTIPADWDYKEMSYVAIVIDNANGQIVNAVEVDIDWNESVEAANNTNFNVYPNPTTGLVKVEGVEGAQVIVYNMLGAVVYNNANASATTTIDLSTFNAGNYIVKVINNEEVATQKIVLTK